MLVLGRTQESCCQKASAPCSRAHVLRRDKHPSLSFLLGSQQGHWYTQFSKAEKLPVSHMARQEAARHM